MLVYAFSRVELWIILMLSVVVVTCSKKQTKWPYKRNIMSKRHGSFNENFTTFILKCVKNWKRAGIQIWEILEDHLLEIIYMQHLCRNN